MAETTSARFGVLVWGASSDGPTRGEFNGNFNALETLGAIDRQDTFANRPAVGVRGTYFWDTTNTYLWRDNGVSWSVVGARTLDSISKSSAIGTVPLTVDTFSGSQTANLLELKLGGSTVTYITKDGDLNTGDVTGKAASFTNTVAATNVIFGKGAAAQSGALLKLQNNASTDRFVLSDAGNITSTYFSNTASSTVLNAATATNVAGHSGGVWAGTPSAEIRAVGSGTFNDFVYLKHDAADNTANTRRLGILMKVGPEDAGGAAKSAAIYLRSTLALFANPSLRVDVRDTNMWEMVPDTNTGSTTVFPVYSNGGYFKAVPSGEAAFHAANTKIGTQASGDSMYFRTPSTSNAFNWFTGGVHSETLNDPGSGGVRVLNITQDTGAGSVQTGKLQLSNVVTLTNATSSPTFMSGPSNGSNIAMSANAIAARNNGSASTLSVQTLGGTLKLGAATTRVEVNDKGFTIGGGNPVSPEVDDVWLNLNSGSIGWFKWSGSAWIRMTAAP